MANYSRVNDLAKIALAKQIIDEIGGTSFTKKQYDNARPRKSVSLDWLRDNHIVKIDHTEEFEIEVPSKPWEDDYGKVERVMINHNGEVLCTKVDWNKMSKATQEMIIKANGGTLLEGQREKKNTITVKRYYYTLDLSAVAKTVDRWRDEALEYAEFKIEELEPKLAKYKAVIATFADEE